MEEDFADKSHLTRLLGIKLCFAAAAYFILFDANYMHSRAILSFYLQCNGHVSIIDFFKSEGSIRGWHRDRVVGDQEEVGLVEEDEVGEVLVQVEHQALLPQVDPNWLRIN